MRPFHRWISLTGVVVGFALTAVACSSAAATPSEAVAMATGTPEAMVSTAPAASPSDTAVSATPAPTAGVLTLGDTDDPSLGKYLTGASGMTLYVLKSDSPDKTTCTGTCATNWPPLTVTADMSIIPPSGATLAFATITRSDGTLQVTYNHMPLYYYSGDSSANDTTGQGKNGVWFVAPESGSLSSSTAPSGY
jgi:predicted lipoprotein with Yx(FWY)xxD motif